MKNIIFKFTQLEQYDADNKTITLADPTESRWKKIYSTLKPGDRGFFIGTGNVYSGVLSTLEDRVHMTFTDVDKFALTADDFLSLSSCNPEQNARVKALFQPYIASQIIDYVEFSKEAANRDFIRFFIVKENSFDASKYVPNDRIVLLGDDFVFKSFGILMSDGSLINPLPAGFFNVAGKSLFDVKNIFEEIATQSGKERSNNVRQVEKIQHKFFKEPFYEFPTFAAYFNIIHNRKAYLHSNISITDFYLAGAFWDNTNPQDQTERFVTGQIWENGYTDKFVEVVNSVRIGSRIAIKSTNKQADTMEIKAIGQVTENPKDGQTLEVDWDDEFQPFTLPHAWGYWDTIRRITNPEHIKEIFLRDPGTIVDSKKTDKKHQSSDARNVILYGPPGTGKTYSTIHKAIQIANPLYKWPQTGTEEEKRKHIKNYYETLVHEGRIQFTTFHQSMSYEDFIEGIKPILDKESSEGLTYQVEPGIFKRIAIDAAFEYATRDDEGVKNLLEFSDLYDMFIEDVGEKLARGEKVYLSTKTGGEIEITHISENDNIWTRHKEGEDIRYTVSKNRLELLYSNIPDLSVVSNINKDFRALIGGMNSTAYWSVLNKLIETREDTSIVKHKKVKSQYTYSEKMAAVSKIDWEKVKGKEVNNYVLIVDEINRGNIAAIFGELITLLEDDKRAGEMEALQTKLPYSKEAFFVPPNLYVLGTMNTADRSIEALDTALRRRFSFEYMPPSLDLIPTSVGSTNLQEVIKQLNERLSYLLDDDHQIGHSYFMHIKETRGLVNVFRNKVIPLLKEFFFNDFKKLYLILGKGFIEPKKQKPKFAVADGDDFTKEEYELKPIDDNFDIHSALTQLLAK